MPFLIHSIHSAFSILSLTHIEREEIRDEIVKEVAPLPRRCYNGTGCTLACGRLETDDRRVRSLLQTPGR
ncbi:hypothetical protein Hanom_Chr09g00846851 [Helianthus anomalus]